MRRQVLAVAAVCILGEWGNLNAAAAAPKDLDVTLNVPVLTVSAADHTGQACRLELHVVRKAGSVSPLSIAVAEDSPLGAGDQMRSSLWQAAMVAAMSRQEPLTGVQITLRTSGFVDGPSAGASLTVAILTALDGKALPGDYAVTGTIMPDGTVGQVGGEPAKIKAAATAGYKRIFLPGFLRFSDETNPPVDLKDLARSLKLEFVPVSHIDELYARIHGQRANVVAQEASASFELPATIEDILKQEYTNSVSAAELLWKSFSDQQRTMLQQDPVMGRILAESEKAKRAYRSGKLLAALECAQTYHAGLDAYRQFSKFIEILPIAQQPGRTQVEKLRNGIKTATEYRLSKLTRSVDYVAAAQRQVSWRSVPLTAGLIAENTAQGVDDYLAASAVFRSAAIAGDDQAKDTIEGTSLSLRFILACGADLVQQNHLRRVKIMQSILPEMRPRINLDAHERLFFSSVLAAQTTLRENLVKTAALQTKTTEEQVMLALLGSDPLFAMSLERQTSLNALHALCANAPAGREKDVAGAITTFVSADQLAVTQALHMRWLELDAVDQADGKRVYKRTDFLSYLLNAARTAAVHNIATCRRSGLICLDALSTYEYAELQRDDEGADKVDVLASYWQASLQAKAMQMMFEATGQ